MIVNSDRLPAIGESSPASAARPWRWSLRTLLLLTAVIAVWTGVWQIRQKNNWLRGNIKRMQLLAHELVVNDPRQYAAIKQPDSWHGEDTWRVYLPPERDYRIKLASRDIGGSNYPTPAAQTDLTPGKHEITCRAERQADRTWRLSVLVDAQVELDLPQEADWRRTVNTTSTGIMPTGTRGVSRTTQRSTDRPLVLKRSRFHRSVSSGRSDHQDGRRHVPRRNPSVGRSDAPVSSRTDGILLWIEARN